LHYLLCGFSGCGKSYKLNQLAKLNDYDGHNFIDLDQYIAEKYGYSHDNFTAVIQNKGWEWFRAIEKKELKLLMASPEASWIALGGGTLDEELANEILLNPAVKCFWLDTDFEVCWERIKDDLNRPLVLQGKELMHLLYQDRHKIYCKFDKLV
jgi:shikimate kinase